MRLLILQNTDEMAELAANAIMYAIKKHEKQQKVTFVLGLCTGSSPIDTYKLLISYVKRGILSFNNVTTFNMDEYIGISRSHPETYTTFMKKNLFDHVDIPDENVNIPNSEAKDLIKECKDYEEKIDLLGGFDFFLGGLGNNGHVAFNEPGSSFDSLTRVVELSSQTKEANSRFFGNDPSLVPSSAISIGLGTLKKAKTIVILANGLHKANAIHFALECQKSENLPISALQDHPSCTILCDESACSQLDPKTTEFHKSKAKEYINDLIGSCQHN